MSIENYYLSFQTFYGGLAIINGADHKIGTLGFVGASDNGNPWIVSCHHVLYPSDRQLQDDEKELIYQPSRSRSPTPIAEVSNKKTDEQLDIAAAKLVFGLPSDRILNLGQLAEPVAAERGMRVLKSGAKTGVTEGVILAVSESLIVIGKNEETPDGYILSDVGDSGSLWVRADDRAPVGLHFEGNLSGAEFAKARPIQLVLETLKLKMFTP